MKWLALLFLLLLPEAYAAEDLPAALRRSQYLLNGTMPTNQDFASYSGSQESYRQAVRAFVDGDNFYESVLRYHERIFGVGLPEDYLDELLRDDIDGKQEKFASITCGRSQSNNRFSCNWTSNVEARRGSGCPAAWEQPVSVFWYPGIVAWVCPSIANACGQDLSRCFIESNNEDEARNSELGTTEAFDSRYAVMRSLSRQAAGLATAVVMENYPYTKVLEPGLSAVDGAIAHFYSQQYHFRIQEMNLNAQMLGVVQSTAFTDTRYKLVKVTDYSGTSGGILSSFGWLRRYDKNRTRANELYKRLLCSSFSSGLPRVFPQDPGNLRVTPGCEGCHSVLDPLADFFLTWGEGADLYSGRQSAVETTFAGHTGTSLTDLANIIRNDTAFATCTVQNVWYWMMGREFDKAEEPLREAFTNYFVNTGYSFRELVYAVATHPAFTEGTRSNGAVADPITSPPLGEVPTVQTFECSYTYNFATDVAPKLGVCTGCHNASSTTRQDLSSEAQWRIWRDTAIPMMNNGVMPIGPKSSESEALRQAVTCWTEQNP